MESSNLTSLHNSPSKIYSPLLALRPTLIDNFLISINNSLDFVLGGIGIVIVTSCKVCLHVYGSAVRHPEVLSAR